MQDSLLLYDIVQICARAVKMPVAFLLSAKPCRFCEGRSSDLQVGEAAMLAALRKKMELLVLSLPSGSYAQRVQAEYLKELETRTQAAFQAANAQ